MNGFVIVGNTTKKTRKEKADRICSCPALYPIMIGEKEYHVHGCIDCPGAIIRSGSVYCGFQNANQPYAKLTCVHGDDITEVIIGKGCPLLTKECEEQLYQNAMRQWDKVWIAGIGYVNREDAESIRKEMI